ncbi:MAG: hypothetical protein V4692_13735 [Bdellovibrionota bacterium]
MKITSVIGATSIFLILVCAESAFSVDHLNRPSSPAPAKEKISCAKTSIELKAFMGDAMKERWIETTADDGKPLKIEITSKEDLLYFVFDKTNEGVWAEGRAEVCKEAKNLVLKITGKDIKLGPKAPFPIRISMGSGAKFKLRIDGPDKLHVSTFGWSGDFIPLN